MLFLLHRVTENGGGQAKENWQSRRQKGWKEENVRENKLRNIK
jgi:hypothetical protein